MEIFLFFVVWWILAWGVSAIAISRGRSAFGFFLLAFLLSPPLGLIIVLLMSDLITEQAKTNLRRKEDHERQIESIKAIAIPSLAVVEQTFATASVTSVADEIRKLGALRVEGLLTDAEFQSQKAHLLKSSVRHSELSVESLNP